MQDNGNVKKQIGETKKPYSSPELSFYGDVCQITRGGAGSGTDGGQPGMSRQCWIAEALYGVDAPRTLLVRAWLTESYDRRAWWAMLIVPLYRTFGRQVAATLRRHSSLKMFFRPVFDHAVRHAHEQFAIRAALLNAA